MTRVTPGRANGLLATVATVAAGARMLEEVAQRLRAENAALRRDRDDLLELLAAATQVMPDGRLPRRRPSGRTPVPPPPAAPVEAVTGPGGLSLDPAARRALAGGQEIPLSPREFDLLAYLLGNRGHAVSKEALRRAVWPGAPDDDLRTVRVHVSGIRAKLERFVGLPVRITTLHRVGYRLDLLDEPGSPSRR
ncbi:MAG: two-component system response regulator [Chloroflexi bacterium]|nr:two-component system response regulator [Chloroflexota bacterium]